ncbi:aminoacyl-tRNA hydrolase [Aeromicrobium duanguangcaii]|uniref:Peptidyl-tRNA hydrolase n=1 Tax=Aeromicrobium duanguangcaii TaxID=2968086 RepID=A0ABY5KH34_9ACTN|nr:aminoacyl-tRNA hydrolase [Aeromicrobium duanguangcaii]MCD9153801.1 aminoacyl-tRNA hydrolase [Aeromicrobium duanguangcaii]UUI69114.1 aminoacyl-tRNA hydrolase [Aeromicrobium duanguangcaii]
MTWLVVGLGNPGSSYAATRHNVGYHVTDELAARMGGRFSSLKAARADVVSGLLSGQRAVLGRSRSYMNESGGAVSALLKYYDVTPDHLIVIHDELDLPLGSLRCKLGGGDNGHNGLKSIRQSIGTGDFLRVRFGIGRPPGQQTVHDFVLKPFAKTERTEADIVTQEAADAVESLISVGLQQTQSAFNS